MFRRKVTKLCCHATDFRNLLFSIEAKIPVSWLTYAPSKPVSFCELDLLGCHMWDLAAFVCLYLGNLMHLSSFFSWCCQRQNFLFGKTNLHCLVLTHPLVSKLSVLSPVCPLGLTLQRQNYSYLLKHTAYLLRHKNYTFGVHMHLY